MRAASPIVRRCLWAAALSSATGCELQDITVAGSEDLVIAEVFVQFNRVEGTEAFAFLHRTLDGSSDGDGTVPGADVRLILGSGATRRLLDAPSDDCLVQVGDEEGSPVEPVAGSCYTADGLVVSPGDTLRLEIETIRGERLWGQTVVPGGFTVTSPPGLTCALEPLTTYPIEWTASKGAWAYVSETLISGLRDALADEGIFVETDPLSLVGLSISAEDTTIVFPSEFGVFERFDLDRDLALVLQEGLPEGTLAYVIVAALDRNWVNWERGGSFNPSGFTRLPSVQGDGTGVFGSAVRQTVGFDVTGEGQFHPCGG